MTKKFTEGQGIPNSVALWTAEGQREGDRIYTIAFHCSEMASLSDGTSGQSKNL